MTNEELVQVIRSDSRVGRGTCTTIDECYDAADLVREFGHITSRRELLHAVYAREGLAVERMLNQRWGEDSDPELAIAAEWRASGERLNSRGETRNQAKARRARERRAARRVQIAALDALVGTILPDE